VKTVMMYGKSLNGETYLYPEKKVFYFTQFSLND